MRPRQHFRIVGADTRRNAANATDISDDFLTAVKESFNQEYQSFNLLVRFGMANLSQTVPAARSTDTSSAGQPEWPYGLRNSLYCTAYR